jgi:hypothetical protein
MHKLIWTGLAVLLVCGAAAGGFVLGSDGVASSAEATSAHQLALIDAKKDAIADAAAVASASGKADGLPVGRREGSDAGQRAGAARGEAKAREEEERIAAAAEAAAAEAEAARLADAADSGYEDDGGAYDPTPPPAGFYPNFEAFCADQPEETECGGPGDPAPG